MRTVFFILMAAVALFTGMDIIFRDATRNKSDSPSVAGALGIKPTRRRPESVAVFLIATVAMIVVLIVEVLA